MIRKKAYESVTGTTLSIKEYIDDVFAENEVEENENVNLLSQLLDMSQLDTSTHFFNESQQNILSLSTTNNKNLYSSNALNIYDLESTIEDGLDVNTEILTANSMPISSNNYVVIPTEPEISLQNSDINIDDSQTLKDIKDVLHTADKSYDELNSDNITNQSQISDQVIIDTDKRLATIRKTLLLLNRVHISTYLLIKRKITTIYESLEKLRKSLRTKQINKNHLSASFLKIFVQIFKCPTLNNDKLHDLFKIIINCYVLNFKFFTKADKTQFQLLFQFIFDWIFINIKMKHIKSNNKPSYILLVEKHKVKTQLTATENKDNVQILLYYLIQLLFLLIETKINDQEFTNKQYIESLLRKLLAFLIVNHNPELLRLFRQNRYDVFRKSNFKR